MFLSLIYLGIRSLDKKTILFPVLDPFFLVTFLFDPFFLGTFLFVRPPFNTRFVGLHLQDLHSQGLHLQDLDLVCLPPPHFLHSLSRPPLLLRNLCLRNRLRLVRRRFIYIVA